MCKFKKGDLVSNYRPHPRLPPHLHLHPRLHPRRERLRPRLPLRPDVLGVVVEVISKSEAWLDFNEYSAEEQNQIQNCYVVYWQQVKKKCLIYENEVVGLTESKTCGTISAR